MPSRTSGSVALAWRATNTPTSTSPTSPATRVDAEVQPTSGARTTAKTMDASPTVTVVAPARSTVPRRAAPAGITDGVNRTTAAASGTLMKNTHGQDAYSVRTPPRNTPAVPPAGAAAP